ncbi:MAG: 2Fe-2S iron-sulfur cluster-binding protein [Bacteroidota bacterium]
MSFQIEYAGLNQKVEVGDPDASLLNISVEHQIPHLHECGGHGQCTTCRVRILNGLQNLSPKTKLEKQTADARKWDPSIRLACQCYPKGNVQLQRLVWSSGEVNKLQTEMVPEGRAEERPVAILFATCAISRSCLLLMPTLISLIFSTDFTLF